MQQYQGAVTAVPQGDITAELAGPQQFFLQLAVQLLAVQPNHLLAHAGVGALGTDQIVIMDGIDIALAQIAVGGRIAAEIPRKRPDFGLKGAAGQVVAGQKAADGPVVLHIQGKKLQALQLFIHHHLGLHQNGVLVVEVFLPQQALGVNIVEQQGGKWQNQHDQETGQQPVKSRPAVRQLQLADNPPCPTEKGVHWIPPVCKMKQVTELCPCL